MADFIRRCGFYDTVSETIRLSSTTTPNRFRETNVSEECEDMYTSLPVLFGDVQAEDRTSTDTSEPAFSRVWSGLTSPFSWTASKRDMDIPVMVF
ncbi:hypothetical protein V5O48_009113 [Marasmius crinis-equi]|uniref:Uncharacterized protein n=1 Tax=Marasmius crinis-equi TaxID=585013 RepID=A0ABR3FC41_9AGAR